MFKKVGSFIKLSPRYSKSSGAVSALIVRQIAAQILVDMCRDYPLDLVKKIKPTVYKNGVLTIDCPNVANAELYMRSAELIGSVNKKIGQKVLRSVKFRTS